MGGKRAFAGWLGGRWSGFAQGAGFVWQRAERLALERIESSNKPGRCPAQKTDPPKYLIS